MNKTATGLLLSGVLLTGCARRPEIPVREFFRNPESSAYRLSPKGAQISFLKPSGKSHRLNIFIRPVSGGEGKRVTTEDDRDVWPYYFWKDEDHIVYFVHRPDDSQAQFHVCCLNLKASENQVQDRTPPGFSDIIDELRDVPDKVLVNVAGNACLLNILKGQGQTELVERNPGDVQQWISDPSGNVLAAIAGDNVNLRLLTRPEPHGEFNPVLKMNFRESISPRAYGFDEGERPTQFHFVSGITVLLRAEERKKVFYALSNMRGEKCRDKFALVKIDPVTGQEIEESYSNPDFDVSDIEVSRKGHVICAKFETWRNERKCLDHPTELLYHRLEEHFPNDDVQITAYDNEETKLIVKRSSDQNPGEYYLFEPETGDLKKLGEYAPQLQGHLAPTKPICFISRDKRTINGYLTLPVGRMRTNLPLVVVPHGGPWWRNVWGFSRENREVQFFASRGYAVLQVNFRTSIGYGREFWESGFKKWGQTLQDDVTDGVLWAIEQRIADPKRVAIVGESYGGYAALAGIAFIKEVHYAAAVDRAGISDLPMLFIEHRRDPMLPQLKEKIGDPEKGPEMRLLQDFSPALHCDGIKTPLFIAHGRYDGVVSPQQATTMCEALAKQGIHIDIQWLPEGHIFENEENLIAYYEAVDAFLKNHLR